MPTVEAPISAKVEEPAKATESLPDPVEGQLPTPYRTGNGRNGSAEVIQRCIDLVVSGNKAIGPARQMELIASALEMTKQLAHAPFDTGRSLVQSAVVVDVDVDVDVASRQCAPRDQEERR